MSKLSVALATYNEEKNIARCLESVKDLASEVVIVDGTSTDSTVKIAESFGAKVTSVPNNPNFHVNKQKAIDACTNPWILQLDADEVVSAGLKREIEKILKSGQMSDPNGYFLPRKNWFLGRFLMKGGQYPDYTLRLYKNGKGRLPQKDVHEQAVVDGEVGHLKEALLHYPYKNFRVYLSKWQRYNKFAGGILKTELKGQSLFEKIWTGVKYVIFMPAWWFLWTYGRHKGFMDGWSGFVFCFFSALRFPMIFLSYLL